MGDYHKAPTTLYNLDGESQTFRTQEEVDTAWGEGWFGPPWLIQDTPLLSTKEWDTKGQLVEETKADPRYEGIALNKRKSLANLILSLLEFEEKNEVEDFQRGE